MSSSTTKSPIAQVLRAEGFIPLPRLWVPASEMEDILKIAKKHGDRVNAIRGELRAQLAVSAGAVDPRSETRSDPKTDRDAAWAAYEQGRGTR